MRAAFVAASTGKQVAIKFYPEGYKPDHVVLEVDGGVNSETITKCAESGADLLVVGSAIFKQPDYRVAVEQLHTLLG